jgi:hypothetical protein
VIEPRGATISRRGVLYDWTTPVTNPAADSLVSRVGLCLSCQHVDVIRSSHESTFYRCRRSETDPAFRKYPVLPVVACRGYERDPAS